MDGKQQLRFAVAAAAAGVAWGWLRHRRSARAPLIALLQGLEWFVAYGGAATLIEGARTALEGGDGDPALDGVERITHIRQIVEERTGTDG
jgi:hypothetical protein